MITVAAALADARRRGVDSLDAQLLLARVLGTTRTGLIAHDERPLAPAEAARWQASLERRLDGEPVAYLLGEKEFDGILIDVDHAVLVPRPETELLVEWAVEAAATLGRERPPSAAREGLRVVDLGTGSGAVALAIKRRLAHCAVTATDASAAALAVARRNSERLGLALELIETSWWQRLAGRGFDVAVANPPYIAGGDPHLDALRHEPTLALTPGGDDLDALRAIVGGAPACIAAGGWLLLEHGFEQAAAVREMLSRAGFTGVESRRDLGGHERATGGRLGRF